jgi:hypothetical protein
MTNQTANTADTLDVAIDAVLQSMAQESDHTSDTYQTLTERLATLYKMKEIELSAAIKREEIKLQDDKLANDVINDAKANALKEEELNQKQQELDNFRRVSMTTIVTIGANLVTILAILKHEQTNVITSKALSFVGKMIK